jgi:hypothetical protein
MDDDAADSTVSGRQDLGPRRRTLDEPPEMCRGAPAQNRVRAASLDCGDVVRLATRGLMSDPVYPSIKREESSAL